MKKRSSPEFQSCGSLVMRGLDPAFVALRRVRVESSPDNPMPVARALVPLSNGSTQHSIVIEQRIRISLTGRTGTLQGCAIGTIVLSAQPGPDEGEGVFQRTNDGCISESVPLPD